ncbi:hypothetical protein PEC18_35730 [Paucibacter sp. O1-1]|nr:hypothetical protein [Paucibacter sp. O1-1]MDA3831010.1 hypothetical protein [Paucibacter sp. O1-1]
MLVELPGKKRTLPIDAWGLAIRKETKVVSMEEEMAKASKASATSGALPAGGQSAATAGGKFTDQVKKAVATANVPPDQAGTGPLLRWEVANESSIYGYGIYRASQESGPFSRVNADIIRKVSVDGSGSSYAWRDNSAVSGQTYWYYIGAIHHTGKKEKLGEPAKVVAK